MVSPAAPSPPPKPPAANSSKHSARIRSTPALDDSDREVLHEFFAVQGDLKLFQEWWEVSYCDILAFFRRPEIRAEVEEYRDLARLACDIRLADGLTAAIDELTRVIRNTPDNDLFTGRLAAQSLIRLASRRNVLPKDEVPLPQDPRPRNAQPDHPGRNTPPASPASPNASADSPRRAAAEESSVGSPRQRHPTLPPAQDFPSESNAPAVTPEASTTGAPTPDRGQCPPAAPSALVPPPGYRLLRDGEPTSLDDIAVIDPRTGPVARFKRIDPNQQLEDACNSSPDTQPDAELDEELDTDPDQELDDEIDSELDEEQDRPPTDPRAPP